MRGAFEEIFKTCSLDPVFNEKPSDEDLFPISQSLGAVLLQASDPGSEQPSSSREEPRLSPELSAGQQGVDREGVLVGLPENILAELVHQAEPICSQNSQLGLHIQSLAVHSLEQGAVLL